MTTDVAHEGVERQQTQALLGETEVDPRRKHPKSACRALLCRVQDYTHIAMAMPCMPRGSQPGGRQRPHRTTMRQHLLPTVAIRFPLVNISNYMKAMVT